MKMWVFYSYTLVTPAQMERALDQFAELLAMDRFTLADIARRMEVTVGTACVLLRELCLRYGEAVAA
jgi:hypothetical protein